MKRLLSIELTKIWKNRASRILTITYFVLLSLIALVASIKFNIGNFKLHLAEIGIFNFPYIWHFNTYMASWFKIFLAVVIVSMMANEYSYGTLKQNLIDGLSKAEFIKSKFLTVLLFSGISTIFIFVMSLILGLSFSSYNELDIMCTDLEYLLAYFIKLTAFFSFCLFLGILIKRSAFALGFLILWWIFEAILWGMLRWQVLKDEAITNGIMQFFPLASMSNLIREPFTRMSVVREMGAQIGVDNIKNYGLDYSAVAIAIVWTVIFVFLSFKLLKKRDL